MSNRTIIELNHDYCPHGEEEAAQLGRLLTLYMSSGDTDYLPNGIRYFGMRHHSDPLPDLTEFPSKSGHFGNRKLSRRITGNRHCFRKEGFYGT